MRRFLCSALLLFTAASVSANDGFLQQTQNEDNSIATTARIVRIDAKKKTFRVRGSDIENLSARSASPDIFHARQGSKTRIGLTLPGGITIVLPGTGGKTPSTKAPDASEDNNEEYTVATTKDTLFQDGGDDLRFEDFKVGESISIHGVLNGNVLTASRVAKWL